MKKTIYLDIETEADCDLGKVGLWDYAKRAKILTAAVAVEDGPVQTVNEDGDLSEIVLPLTRWGHKVVAHNAVFERILLGRCWKFTSSAIPYHAWGCSMVAARSLNLPGGLDPLYQRLFPGKVGKVEDMAVQVKLGKPGTGLLADREALEEYCRRDVEITREVWDHLYPHVCTLDRVLTWVDMQINMRGWPVDIQVCGDASRAVMEERDRLDDWAKAFYPKVLGEGDRVLGRKQKVRELAETLREDNRGEAAGLLLAKAEWDWQLSAAQAKWEAGMACMQNEGHRARLMLVARNAHSGRWTGKGLQPHNMKRSCDSEVLDTRRMIAAAPGYRLVVADFRQMELRLGLYCARADHHLSMLADGRDLYEELARSALGTDPTKAQRNHMKSIVLGIMYGQGRDRTLGRVKEEGAPSHLADALWRELERDLLAKFRSAWKRLMSALENNLGGKVDFPQSTYLTLPQSSRLLFWHDYRKEGDDWTYESYDGGQWGRQRLWGSKAFSHVVSGAASDILARVLIKAELEFANTTARIIGHVHDEIVVEVREDEADATAKSLCDWMRVSAGTCPMEAEVGVGQSWREAK